MASEADTSNPAEWGEPRVGITALVDRNFTCSSAAVDSSSLLLFEDDILMQVVAPLAEEEIDVMMEW